MHVKTKQLALSGLLMALSVVCIVMGSIIEFDTLAFLLLASFISGIVIYEMKIGIGAMFIAGTFLLGFLLGPNKMYSFTYLAFAGYIWLAELIYVMVGRASSKSEKTVKWSVVIWVLKYIAFNAIFIPCVLLFPELIVGVELTGMVKFGLILAGQVALVVLDMAYNTFIIKFWVPLSKRIA